MKSITGSAHRRENQGHQATSTGLGPPAALDVAELFRATWRKFISELLLESDESYRIDSVRELTRLFVEPVLQEDFTAAMLDMIADSEQRGVEVQQIVLRLLWECRAARQPDPFRAQATSTVGYPPLVAVDRAITDAAIEAYWNSEDVPLPKKSIIAGISLDQCVG